MRRQPSTIRIAVGLFAATVTACGSSVAPAGPPAPPSALATILSTELAGSPPATFVALDDRAGIGNQPVAIYDTKTGKVISRLLPGSVDGMNVVNLALDGSGSLWVTYSRGPRYRSDGPGGDPAPNSCANDVFRVNLATGRSTTVLSTGDNELVGGAWPSPDGRMYVYTGSGCATSYFNTHFTVVATVTGISWTIGAALPPCHSLSAPAWTPDSRSLVVAYGSAIPGNSLPGGCAPWNPARLLVVSALRGQDGLSGTSASPDPSCVFNDASALLSGPVGVEHCDASSTDTNGQYIDGPARLVLFDAHLRVRSRMPLGQCDDGGELAANHADSTLLVAAYLYCPGTTQPITKLWSYSSSGLRLLTQVPGDADPFGSITW